MTGGSLVYTTKHGSLFSVTNCMGVITLSGIEIAGLCETLLAAAGGDSGSVGSNGGNATLVADDESLTGDLIADAVSTLRMTLKNRSSLTGAINPDRAAKEANLALDATSTWNVTGDSYLTGLTLTGGISADTIANIRGNGYTIYYDAGSTINSALGGKTYGLSLGGSLKPAN